MPNPFQITQFSVSEVAAPAPSKLQRSGAMVSRGGTTLAAGSIALITQLSDLTAILAPQSTIGSIAWDSTGGGTVTVASAQHGIPVGESAPITISGAAPDGYNGNFSATATDVGHFTYSLASNPGTSTTNGTWAPRDVLLLVAACNTYFAQGPSQAYWILETGELVTADALAAFQTYLAANPNTFYSFLFMSFWAIAGMATYAATFTAPTALQYFWIQGSQGTETNFLGIKSVNFWVEAPGAPVTEFGAAADWAVTLSLNPSSSTPVPPNSYAFLFGVTPWPVTGQNTELALLKSEFVNVIAPASVGGLTNSMVYLGTYMDGNPFNFWYSQDWVQINGTLDLNAAVINGSNNKLAPLYYNQQGINQLQRTLVSTMTKAITFGLALGQLVQTQLPQAQFVANFQAGLYAGQVVVNADPFVSYTTENPNDYAAGNYNGLSVAYTPLRGFTSIIVGLVVTDFPSGA